MNTLNTPEQLIAANKASLEAALKLAGNAFARAERLAALNLNVARGMLEDSMANTKALMTVKSPQDLANLQATLSKPILEKAVSYARSVYELAAENQKELATEMEAQIAALNTSIHTALDEAAKSAPAGSDVMFGMVKSAMAASNSAYADLSKAAKELAAATESNLNAATEATVKAVSTASKAA